MNRDGIVEGLKKIIPAERVITEEQVLKDASVDRFRKYENICGVYTQPIPAAIAYAESAGEVSRILRWASENRISVVPRSGISATEGGLETVVPDTVVLDGSRMNRILSIDPIDMQATCQAGVPLQVLDDKCRAMGLTTGHSPQSKPLALMGGLVATRSIGQFSTLYGGIEEMVVGLEAVFPDGHVARIKNVPRRAAGPDIRHVAIGNEGALCFITEVTVKLFPFYPENNAFMGYILDDMRLGFEILREVMVKGYRPSIARLYDPEDGASHFAHFSGDKCVLIFMAEGPPLVAKATAEAIRAIVAAHPECQAVDPRHIERWFDHLNWDPRNIAEERVEIRETQNIGHTTEISANWSALFPIYEAAMRRVRAEVPDLTLLGGHSSHGYINGANIYFVYYYNLVDITPEQEISKYHLAIKRIIVEETLARGGSMCHHHGVGKHRAAWIREEYGSSYPILETLKRAFDPAGIMNPGDIWPLKG
ncbi:MAG: FAD-binding oxidoreductase [Deltaproteobacteria bacterium]|jgi:alkyldihydroxyacetonephosphate synthase|nr:FAD-binding oxidoreductase [Deltaproteobacteria bacterium]